ncbi:hypothetical protein B0H13DRAFT_1860573 [Mycena leptocephala]|nr:hypothetical protein B0H13DRAFT_1860573 [Mycena leptocephala]
MSLVTRSVSASVEPRRSRWLYHVLFFSSTTIVAATSASNTPSRWPTRPSNLTWPYNIEYLLLPLFLPHFAVPSFSLQKSGHHYTSWCLTRKNGLWFWPLKRGLNFEISPTDNGWHFSAANTSAAQLQDFRIEDMATKMKTFAPELWDLLGLLLSANHQPDIEEDNLMDTDLPDDSPTQ